MLINGDEFDSIGYFYAMSIFPSETKTLTNSDISLHYLTIDFKKCVTKTLEQVLSDGNVFATRKLIKVQYNYNLCTVVFVLILVMIQIF